MIATSRLSLTRQGPNKFYSPESHVWYINLGPPDYTAALSQYYLATTLFSSTFGLLLEKHILEHHASCHFTAHYCLVQVPVFSNGQAQTTAPMSMKRVFSLLGQTNNHQVFSSR